MVAADGLVKRFGEVVAVDGVTLSIGRGSVLGLLGPNGAGKTTIVKMLTTLLSIDAGSATVDGHDVATDPNAVRSRIGLAGQAAAVDEKLTARENLEFFARLYKLDRVRRRVRVAELVERFDMGSYADRPASTYSGGQRRRLDIAVALVADPPALFLDEPTTGLDPRSRAEVWGSIREVSANGAAVLLTTQYLDEADRLADQIVVIDGGRTVASGPPERLKADVGRDVLEVRVAAGLDVERASCVLEPADVAVVEADRKLIHLPVDSGAAQSLELLRRLSDGGVDIDDFQLRRPTLDDVFLALTGAAPADASTNQVDQNRPDGTQARTIQERTTREVAG
jgi:ABC-2 type transport system ATP-binding protein